jgi:ribosomal protein S18 acetylase RimI-like enzyme/uncharacterized protein YciI
MALWHLIPVLFLIQFLSNATAFIPSLLSCGENPNHSSILKAAEKDTDDDLLSKLNFRQATANDFDACYAIESASYPQDEAASEASLIYRQEQATLYFIVATLNDDIIGFCCSTRCDEFTEESMSTQHVPSGKLLAVHSVVVKEEYRRRGIATTMLKNYVQIVQASSTTPPIQSLVLLAKQHLLGFYVNCGFSVIRPSPIIHGQDLWYDLEIKLNPTGVRSKQDDERWFVKTESFVKSKSFLEIKPHLKNHRLWVAEIRKTGHCITSGYRVDEEGKPGDGGLMFLAAKSHDEALAIVLQDPLVENGCVDWKLNGWVSEVGNVQLE